MTGAVSKRRSYCLMKNGKNERGKNEDTSDYLFYRQMKELESLIANFPSRATGKNEMSMSKIIGIIGDRGTGKTSLVQTLKNYLKEPFSSGEAENQQQEYHVFDTVDPSVFGQNLNILEILVSNIYKTIGTSGGENAGYAHRMRTNILMDLKRLTRTLAQERQDDAYFKDKTPPVEVLDEIQSRLYLDKIIVELLNETANYLELEGKTSKDFVLIIDVLICWIMQPAVN